RARCGFGGVGVGGWGGVGGPAAGGGGRPGVTVGDRLVAIATGLAFWLIRGERRIGGYAIAAGLAGLLIGYFATRSSTTKLDTVVVWGAPFAALLRYATPPAFASPCGLFSEPSGGPDIGLERMIVTG